MKHAMPTMEVSAFTKYEEHAQRVEREHAADGFDGEGQKAERVDHQARGALVPRKRREPQSERRADHPELCCIAFVNAAHIAAKDEEKQAEDHERGEPQVEARLQ